jgi:hypothetical protein
MSEEVYSNTTPVEEIYKTTSLSWKGFGRAVMSRIVRIIVSFIVVTLVFILTDTPILATSAGTLAWGLISMFVSISSCLLTSGDK